MISTAPPASRRILIMGGTGTVGSHLMRELLPDRAEFDIIGAAHTPASATRLQTAGYASVRFDLECLETLLPAMQGVDTLFMLKPYSIDYLIQSKRVIDAAVKAGVKHIVNLGSFGADDTPWSSIGWNRLVEAYLRVSGLGFTTLRPNFFMDNVPARTDAKTGQIIHYFGATSVSWIAAQDIARVAAAVLRRPKEFHGHALSLAAEARSMDSIADLLTRHLGRPFVAVHVPAHEALPQLLSRGWQEAFARPFVDYMAAISAGEVREVGDTTRTVEEVTGSPAIDWQAFIAKNRDRFTGAT
jgi:NAD(P)H dehydrogenase (quinone)